MRWQALFADLEAQLEAADRLKLEAEVRDRARRERGLVHAVDRLRASAGSPVSVTLLGAGGLAGRLQEVGPDWLLLDEAGVDVLVPLQAVATVSGLPDRVEPSGGVVEDRLDLRWALRGLARDRAPVRVVLRDGSTLPAVVARVGADHVDLADRPAGELRPSSRLRLVPLSALAALRGAL